MLLQILARSGVVLAFLPGPVPSQDRDADGTVRIELDSLVKKSAEPPWVAVRSQPHDLVFVGVEVEAQMQRDQRVQDSDGIQGGNLGYSLELVPVPTIHRRALRLA